MSFDWNEYILLADYLFKSIPDLEGGGDPPLPDIEAIYRTIISRAYYGVFCSARNKAIENDGYQVQGATHQALQRHFTQNPQDKLRRTIGNQLKQLHSERIKADYNNELRGSPYAYANKALAQAKKILENLENLYV